jgi:molybdopterin molybdotransferase
MITYEQAIEIVRKNITLLISERVVLVNSINRVLREDIYSDINMPPFDKSAMDGYGCRREDIGNELEIVETIQAGYKPQKQIGKNQCSKIMTGAMIPEGADCVIVVEDVEHLSANKIKFKKEKTPDNICFKGEDVVIGQMLIESGTRITEKEIATLALTGAVKPFVSVQPKVGIISTGDEIVEPDIQPQDSQIRNTNAYQIIAQCQKFGCLINYYGIARDSEEETIELIRQAKLENNLVLITGGISMGEFDLVPFALMKNGFELLFQKVAVQPGKPTIFGRSENSFVFGMPGNPVSSFIVFEYFVKELLAGMMGLKNHISTLSLEMDFDFRRKKSDRLARVPVKINNRGKIEPVDYHGSAHIHALTFANGFISIPIGVNEIKKGTIVDVRQI